MNPLDTQVLRPGLHKLIGFARRSQGQAQVHQHNLPMHLQALHQARPLVAHAGLHAQAGGGLR